MSAIDPVRSVVFQEDPVSFHQVISTSLEAKHDGFQNNFRTDRSAEAEQENNLQDPRI